MERCNFGKRNLDQVAGVRDVVYIDRLAGPPETRTIRRMSFSFIHRKVKLTIGNELNSVVDKTQEPY